LPPPESRHLPVDLGETVPNGLVAGGGGHSEQSG